MKRSASGSLKVKSNTILSGTCKCLDERAREESGEEVKKKCSAGMALLQEGWRASERPREGQA